MTAASLGAPWYVNTFFIMMFEQAVEASKRLTNSPATEPRTRLAYSQSCNALRPIASLLFLPRSARCLLDWDAPACHVTFRTAFAGCSFLNSRSCIIDMMLTPGELRFLPHRRTIFCPRSTLHCVTYCPYEILLSSSLPRPLLLRDSARFRDAFPPRSLRSCDEHSASRIPHRTTTQQRHPRRR